MPHVAAAAKKPRKILIYGINYAPEMIGVGRFSGEIGAYLAKNGYDVCVVTAPPHYPGWRAAPPYSALRYARETRTGARTILHVQDLEIDAAFAVGHLEGDRLKNFVLRLNSWPLRRFSNALGPNARAPDRQGGRGKPDRFGAQLG